MALKPDSDGLEVLSKRQLIALLRRKPECFDDADLRRLRDAVVARVRVLQQRAREAKGVLEASEFVRWVAASGLLNLFRGSE